MDVKLSQMEEIVKMMPGNVVVYKVEEGLQRLYYSASLCCLYGYTEEEFAVSSVNALDYMIEEDRAPVMEKVQECISKQREVDYSFRVTNHGTGMMWVRARAKYVGQKDDCPILLVTIADMADENVREKLEESRQSMQVALDAADIIYFEYYPERGMAIEYNKREIFDVDQYLYNYPQSWFDMGITHPDDAEILWDAFRQMKAGAKRMVCDVRNRMNDDYRWHHYTFTSIYDGKGERIKVLATAQDITERKNADKMNEEIKLLYERIPGWIFTCKNDEFWTIIHTNPRVLSMTGYTQEEFEAKFHNQVSRIIPQENVMEIREKILRMEQTGYGAKTSYETPILHKNGSCSYLNVDVYLDEGDDNGILYVSCADITELKENERKLSDSNAMYRLTTEYANINLWQYDIVHDIMYNTENSLRSHGGSMQINDFTKEAIKRQLIRPDSVEAFQEMFEKLRSGQQAVSADIWTWSSMKQEWWCERITHVAIYDETGRAVRAIGMGENITELKLAERRIREERQYQEGVESENLLQKARCNITQGTVERYDARDDFSTLQEGTPYYVFVDEMTAMAYEKDQAAIIRAAFDMQNIQRIMKRQGGTTSIEYRIKGADGGFIWVNTVIRAFENPGTGDVTLFVYTYDIDNRKTSELVINRIAEIDYEFLALVHVDDDTIHCVRGSEIEESLGYGSVEPYSPRVTDMVQALFDEQVQKEAERALQIQTIGEHLEKEEIYTFAYTIYWHDKAYRKRWEFSYLDETRTVVICTRSDITALFMQQEQQKEDLRNALIQAEQANHAKSNFLSRMSHEIRTPMNAIIGMSALAAQCVNDPVQVQDCLSKVGISARFLLSLINDILDMSRIESGKVTLKNEKFAFEEFINNVNTIVYEQATQKGLDYDCVVSSFTAANYIGDAMKLQQILVNLLGNAIKFTDKGGKVQLVIRQEKASGKQTYLVFSVNDTGIGIPDGFQKIMFEPFEQGNSTITTPYKGTGLGLAICKNLVSMLGGTINVNSIENVGSEFTVRVPMEICEDENRYKKYDLPVDLAKLSTLVVDDDITICEHTKELLVDMGMEAEWVESGRQAVQIVQKRLAQNRCYDIILVDWKMPDMDGIETTREIRKLVGPDVTIIVITAYDWIDIEREAKMAGVNLLVSKPLFKSSLISVFEKVYSAKEEKKQETKPVEYDFSGKHVLLVEDHILNIEVAKRLLESKGITVEVAENGLQAIEAYMTADDTYFDAILMDIRMPVMDGLTATRSIRQLRKESAATIPIIAMSANAFDEDVEKSKAAGMDEHLSKPIDPPQLFAALQHWFEKER